MTSVCTVYKDENCDCDMSSLASYKSNATVLYL